MREAERKKRAALVEEARLWETANLLRRYLAHLEATAASDPDPEWKRWAHSVADAMDPTNPRNTILNE
jgi:hypothetical protein